MNDIEQHAIQFRRLHPAIVEVLDDFFPLDFDLEKVKVTMPRRWIGYGVNGVVPMFVMYKTLWVQRGMFNKPYERGDRYMMDLSKRPGMALLAHEVFHVLQSHRVGLLGSIWGSLGGLWRKIAGKGWHSSHREQEAIDFQVDVLKKLTEEELTIFKKYQGKQ